MDMSTSIGFGFLIIISVIGWVFAFYSHKVAKMDSGNCFMMHPALSILFGAWKLVDLRGVILQTSIYVGTPLSALVILDKVTLHQMLRIYLPVMFVFMVLFLVLFYKKR